MLARCGDEAMKARWIAETLGPTPTFSPTCDQQQTSLVNDGLCASCVVRGHVRRPAPRHGGQVAGDGVVAPGRARHGRSWCRRRTGAPCRCRRRRRAGGARTSDRNEGSKRQTSGTTHAEGIPRAGSGLVKPPGHDSPPGPRPPCPTRRCHRNLTLRKGIGRAKVAPQIAGGRPSYGVDSTTVVRVATLAAARISCSRASRAAGEATRTLRM